MIPVTYGHLHYQIITAPISHRNGQTQIHSLVTNPMHLIVLYGVIVLAPVNEAVYICGLFKKQKSILREQSTLSKGILMDYI